MKDIRLLALDVDGTLTDGHLNIGPDGEVYKAFCSKDGLGMSLIREAGVTVALVTGRRSRIVENRAAELNIPYVIQNVQDKPTALRKLCSELNISLEETCFIGDDLIDLGAMQICGVSACPSNAIEEVKAEADFVATVPGGEGAVRQFIDYYLKEKGLWTEVARLRFGVQQ